MPVLFEAGDPEFEPEKPDPSEIQIKRGRKLIRVGLLMLVLGLLMCLFFIILVVGVVPAAISSYPKVEMNQDQVHSNEGYQYLFFFLSLIAVAKYLATLWPCAVTAKGTGPQGRSRRGRDSTHRRPCGTSPNPATLCDRSAQGSKS